MQNYDFARTTRPAMRTAPPPPRYNHAADYRTGGNAPVASKSYPMLYTAAVCLLIGFSGGIGTGLYLANTNKSVRNFITGKQGSELPVTANKVKNTAPAETNEVPFADEVQASELNDKPAAITRKQYLIYAGKFRNEIAHRLGYNLKKKKLPAFLVKSGTGTKLYVGSYHNLDVAEQDLGKMKTISSEYFGNAIIKVHSSAGDETASSEH